MTGRPLSSPGSPNASGSRRRGPGLCPCGREGLGPAPPRRVALLRDLSFDKVRALADVATPENRAPVVRPGQGMLGARAGRHRPLPSRAGPDRSPLALVARWSLLALQRHARTFSAQLPPDSYAQIKARIDAQLKAVPSDGRHPWTSDAVTPSWGSSARLSRALGASSTGATTTSPYVVVAHVPLAALFEDTARRTPWPASSSTGA